MHSEAATYSARKVGAGLASRLAHESFARAGRERELRYGDEQFGSGSEHPVLEGEGEHSGSSGDGLYDHSRTGKSTDDDLGARYE